MPTRQFKAHVLLDSLAPSGVRLTTYELAFPRFILSEFNTHRMISRNASSSRAIPTAKLLADPLVEPVSWGKNQPGMSAGEELGDDRDVFSAQTEWRYTGNRMRTSAKFLADLGIHKQIANRIIEPWAITRVVATATDPVWRSFFGQRCHADAQPEMATLAVLMARAMRDSDPVSVGEGEWHLPYVGRYVGSDSFLPKLRDCSVARCARVSYKSHATGKIATVQEDLALAERLRNAAPMHASPFEHQACAESGLARSGNFHGWTQYRQMLTHQHVTEFDFASLDAWPDYAEWVMEE